MALKTYNPTSPGRRHLIQVDKSDAVEGQARQGARRGQDEDRRAQQRWPYHVAPHRRRRISRPTARLISAAASSISPASVERLEYDPNRTAFIALIKYKDGTQAYILAPQRLGVGDTVVSGAKVDVKPGNAMPLAAMPIGTIVHNVEMKPGKGGQIARSAGSFVQLVGRDRALPCCASTRARRARSAPSAWRPSARCRTPTT